jgi:CheY-like chemotaxis protein
MKKTTRSAAKAVRKKKILVVDDDRTMKEMLSVLLTHSGYEVIDASYALPALFRATRNAPDLIVADLDMPVMNGLELIDQFKGHADTRDIPIVVVTGSLSDESRKEALEAGCAAYMTKPIVVPEFLAQIEKVLKGHGKKQTLKSLPSKIILPTQARARISP